MLYPVAVYCGNVYDVGRVFEYQGKSFSAIRVSAFIDFNGYITNLAYVFCQIRNPFLDSRHSAMSVICGSVLKIRIGFARMQSFPLANCPLTFITVGRSWLFSCSIYFMKMRSRLFSGMLFRNSKRSFAIMKSFPRSLTCCIASNIFPVFMIIIYFCARVARGK